jgi:hypothetical protein
MTELVSVRHERRIPILSQGKTNSCLGQAAMGVLGSQPFLGIIPPEHPYRPTGDADQDEKLAISLYTEASKRDEFPWEYPAVDGGSSCIGVGRACRDLGLIAGFRWVNSLDDVLSALARVPLVVGTIWYTSFDELDPTGVAAIPPSARIRGGHAYILDELDVERQVVGAACSWGPDWGLGGRFHLPFDILKYLLSQRGEAVVFVPKK